MYFLETFSDDFLKPVLISAKMVRKLKFHEKKLLKKVDFISWEVSNDVHEATVIRKYNLKNRVEYTAYNKLSREVRELAQKIKDLEVKDPFRTEATDALMTKLYDMGIIPLNKGLQLCDKVSASAFCRRRLNVILVRLKMAENIRVASQFIEQGHIRVGPELVMDPAFLVPRSLEDFVTWTNASKIKQHVMEYNEMRDDFSLT